VSGVDAVVGPDFPGEGGRLQDDGAFLRADGDGDTARPVSGDQQDHDPAQRSQDDQQADTRGGGPYPGDPPGFAWLYSRRPLYRATNLSPVAQGTATAPQPGFEVREADGAIQICQSGTG
jgi:hypothetical protein